MKTLLCRILAASFLLIGVSRAMADEIAFHPINHASFVIQAEPAVIYVDPVGDPARFAAFPKPDIILITDIHKDHFSKDVVGQVKQADTLIVCPQAVHKDLDQATVLNNGEDLTQKGVSIQAVPAYNLSSDRLKYHPKGRGNGYVVTLAGKRIYISGDTEDIPEMRALTGIDYAFVCMNLPYTMTEDQAASAVLAFSPKVVFPYHYRGKNGFSDLDKFQGLVEDAGRTTVQLLAWY